MDQKSDSLGEDGRDEGRGGSLMDDNTQLIIDNDDTGMSVQNGNFGIDRTTTTKAASVRKHLGTKNSKSNEGRQGKLREEPGVQRSLTE